MMTTTMIQAGKFWAIWCSLAATVSKRPLATLILLVAVGGPVWWFWSKPVSPDLGAELDRHQQEAASLTARTDQLAFTTGHGEDRLSGLARKQASLKQTAALDRLQQEAASLKERGTVLTVRTDQLAFTTGQGEDRLSGLAHKQASLKQTAAQTQTLNAQVSELNQRADTVEKILQKVEQTTPNLKQGAIDLRRTRPEATEQAQEVEKQISRVDAETAKVVLQLAEVESGTKSLQQKTMDLASKASQAISQLDVLGFGISKLRDSSGRLTDQIHSLQKTGADLKAQLEELAKNTAALATSIGNGKPAEIEQRIAAQKAALESWKSRLEESEKALQTLTAQATEATVKLNELETQAAAPAQAVTGLQEQAARLTKQIARVDQQTTELENTTTELQEQTDKLKKQVAIDPSAIKTKYQSTVTEIKQVIAQLREKVNKDKQAVELRQSVVQFQELTDRFDQETDTLMKQIEKQIEQQEPINLTVAELQTRLQSFEKESQDLGAMIDQLLAGIPRCLIPKSERWKRILVMLPVGELRGETLPSYLDTFIMPFAGKTVSEAPFYIMRREVKVAEFRAYVETLDDDTKRRLGNAWKEGNGVYYPDGNPVAAVPWWAAKGYADWLARETGCPLSLPTYNQWVAAAIKYSRPEKAVLRRETSNPMVQHREDSPSTVVDLLGNLREWSLDSDGPKSCSQGSHYALGEDYKTYLDKIDGMPRCLNDPLSTIGFRLVMPMMLEGRIAREAAQ